MSVERRQRRSQSRGELHLGAVSSDAVDALDQQGIKVRTWAKQPPEDPPGVPRTLASERDSVVMALFQDLSGWLRYLGIQLAAAEVDERSAERAVQRHEARQGYDFRKVDAKERAEKDDRYQGLKDDLEGCNAYRKMVEALYKSVDHDSFTVSREITRRGARAGREHRVERA